jgi:hypothetical protein
MGDFIDFEAWTPAGMLVTHGPKPTMLCTTCALDAELPVASDGSVPSAALARLEQAHRHGEAIYGWSPSPVWPPRTREGR